MKITSDAHEKMMSAFSLLQAPSISVSTFEHIRTLIKGLHPGIDSKLEICSKALANVQKLESGDMITLSAESLPEDTEEKKKKKKALLFFISSVKDLKNEIKRVEEEFAKGNSSQNDVKQWGRIVKYAKGPFGIITLIAVVVVVFLGFTSKKSENILTKAPLISPSQAVTKGMIQVITYNGKQIPLSQLRIVIGNHCDYEKHYHALASTGLVTAIDGTIIQDPGMCGFGKVKDVAVSQVAK